MTDAGSVNQSRQLTFPLCVTGLSKLLYMPEAIVIFLIHS